MTNVDNVLSRKRHNGKRKMIGQKSHGELNRGGWTEGKLGHRGRAGAAGTVLTFVFFFLYAVSVQAEPATLRSPDATVYEQTSEGSNAVGNLVEGGFFEYLGDVTAEDGSVWHQITTAGGVSGYIRGDREIEIGTAEPAPEGQEGQEAPAGEGGNGEPAVNPPEGEGEPAPAEEGANPGEGAGAAAGEEPHENDRGNVPAPGNNNGEDTREEPGEEEAPEGEETSGDDAEGLPEDEDAVPVFNMQNNQTKKYVVDNSQKIKERESFTEVDIGTKASKSRGLRIDKALIAGIAVVLLCGGMIQVCWTRMKRMRKGVCEGSISVPDGNRNRTHRKAERKKHNQKKKSTKIIQGKKRI